MKVCGWASLIMGAQLGKLEWSYLPGLRYMVERASSGGVSLSVGAL
jgi:hypothetical protein